MKAQHFLNTLFFSFILSLTAAGQASFPFSYTPLTEKTDFSAKMVDGADHFLTRETERVKQLRSGVWKRDFSSGAAFQKSITAERNLLARRLGVVEERVAPQVQLLTNLHAAGLKPYSVELPRCRITAVRWQVLDGLSAEGILLKPKGKILARIVMVPDADVQPEVLAGLQQANDAGFGAAQELANAGCEVIIPALVSRDDRYSGSKSLNRFTNQPHREWIYRQAYEVGRHVIGYELQKIFSAIDWLESENSLEGNKVQIGVAGHGEGGLLALYAAALDQRISATLVSGYFDSREQLWQEPIYRNVFGLLNHFGDAEIAVMAWPRKLIVEYARGPEVTGPPAPSANRSGGAPGIITTPVLQSAKAEWDRAKAIVPDGRNHLLWVAAKPGNVAGSPLSATALKDFMKALQVELPVKPAAILIPLKPNEWVDAEQRQERTVREMEAHVQRVVDTCYRSRDENFWQTLKGDIPAQQPIKAAHRKELGQVLGELPTPSIPANPKARLLQETDKWTSYEITLDVYAPDVFAWGILLIPKGIKPGEKRPVVVCQHGLEGLPSDVLTTDTSSDAYGYYKSFAAKLAERGYVTFAPHNYYRGEDKFRVLQRKANPVGLTLFSIITSQHRRIVEWLGQQSFVDPARIGFYGLSYGGKTAMRVPALVEGYCLSICSADFNEWIIKNSTIDYPLSYLFLGEYDMPEWDLGHTFNYAEMATLIAPRPFMVERGHDDGVSIDEWVDFEYAKVRRHYAELGIPENTAIEHFKGPHTIHGVGSFEFLDRHLKKIHQ
ncbi:alpha/beta hydrolase family protein [Flavihumibacter profundi]|uniref:alpha/beta hydrolase family protein n=1 Tax=Flavihumibacter profundi TaxID=2716883 RepID=UPI001CC3C420|nr:dienelactone hydrolase family protein [Flavihumibacter profundi]MBZ5856429.1 dienelactone hydrolase family protein [Flavihumibacter profundi]